MDNTNYTVLFKPDSNLYVEDQMVGIVISKTTTPDQINAIAQEVCKEYPGDYWDAFFARLPEDCECHTIWDDITLKVAELRDYEQS